MGYTERMKQTATGVKKPPIDTLIADYVKNLPDRKNLPGFKESSDIDMQLRLLNGLRGRLVTAIIDDQHLGTDESEKIKKISQDLEGLYLVGTKNDKDAAIKCLKVDYKAAMDHSKQHFGEQMSR